MKTCFAKRKNVFLTRPALGGSQADIIHKDNYWESELSEYLMISKQMDLFFINWVSNYSYHMYLNKFEHLE